MKSIKFSLLTLMLVSGCSSGQGLLQASNQGTGMTLDASSASRQLQQSEECDVDIIPAPASIGKLSSNILTSYDHDRDNFVDRLEADQEEGDESLHRNCRNLDIDTFLTDADVNPLDGRVSKAEVEAHIRLFDQNNNGKLDRPEYDNFVATYGPGVVAK